ncbi:MAG: c-type cytochrome [Rhizobiaceae bacterium]|nr:c-type cytochrome [Rhizobiaceae bacterium]
MKMIAALVAILVLAGGSQADDIVEIGRQIAEFNCSECHAVGTDDESRHPEAPPFRHLSQRYPLDALEEAFAEGIYVGHPDMPTFEATPDQLAALLAYLATIQMTP